MSDVVSLYTSIGVNAENPQVYQYYLDQPGQTILQLAISYCQLPSEYQYNILIRYNQEQQAWFDINNTLRAYGVSNGMMLQIIPNVQNQVSQYSSSPLVPDALYQSQYAPSPLVYGADSGYTNSTNALPPPPPSSIQANQYESAGNYNSRSSMMESDLTSGYVDDLGIIIDSRIDTNSAATGFGALRQSNFELTHQMPPPTTKGYKVLIYDGYSDKNPVEVKYYLNYSFEDILVGALIALGQNRDGRYCLMLVMNGGQQFWINEDQTFENFQCNEGMELYVFKRDIRTRINTLHFHPRSAIIDITKIVGDIVKELSEQLRIESYFGYSLFSKDGDKEVLLDPDCTIPQQTQSMKEFSLKRAWFVLSRIDLVSMTSARIAYKDAKERFIYDDLPMNIDQALYFAALIYFVENENTRRGKVGPFPNDISYMFPPSFTDGKDLGPELESYINNSDRIDQFNAIRQFLQFVREFPGFASQNFECTIQTSKAGITHSLEIILEIGPLRLLIIDSNTGNIEERVSYTKIVKLEIVDDVLDISFASAPGRVSKYSFIGLEMGDVLKIINRYTKIVQKIIIERANNTELLPRRISEKNRILLKTTNDRSDANPREYYYDSNYTGKVLVKMAEMNLGIQHDDDNLGLIKFMDNLYQWVLPEQLLGLLNIQNGMVLYILPKFSSIKIQFVDETSKVIRLDISKKIEVLTEDVFKAIEQPPLTGFTFWVKEENQIRPLDIRNSIPEQCKRYNVLLFRRRFFTLSSEVLQTPLLCQQAVIEMLQLIVEGKCEVTEDEAIELAALAVYAIRVQSTSDVPQIQNFDFLEKLLPNSIKITPKLVDKFKTFLFSMIPMEKVPASKKFLGKVRKLPGFGSETYDCTYQDVSPGVQNAKIRHRSHFTITPLYIFITHGKNKDLIYQIGYRFIISYEIASPHILLKFIGDKKGTISIAKLGFKELDTVVLLLGYNIKLINDLILSKQIRSKQEIEETTKRLRGGFIDSQGKIHGPMMDFFITTDPNKLENLHKFWIDLAWTGKEIVDNMAGVEGIEIADKVDYAVVIRFLDKMYKWIGENESLESKSPYRSSLILILERFPKIEIIPPKTMSLKSKSIKLDISKPIRFLLPRIGELFGISQTIGYTLSCQSRTKEIYVLDSNRAIPEQVSNYDTLELVYKHFVLPSSFISDSNSLIQIYKHAKQLVLSGEIVFNPEQVVKLLYFSMGSDLNGRVDISCVPKDFNEWVPKGMKAPKTSSIKSLIKDNPLSSAIDSMSKYLDYCREIRGFSTFMSSAKNDLFENAKKQIDNTVIVFLGPDHIEITDNNQKNSFGCIRYSRILHSEFSLSEVSFDYLDEKGVSNTFNLICEKASSIHFLILEHQALLEDMFLSKAINFRKDKLFDNEEFSVTLCVILDGKKKDSFDHKFSKIRTGAEIISESIKILDLDPYDDYSGLLQVAQDHYRWIRPTDLLGLLNPTNGMNLFIFHTLMRVPVSTSDGFTEDILIDITKPLYEIVPKVAARFYIDFWIGYTLWKPSSSKSSNPEELIPLDLQDTIPEQCISFRNLIFKRRFYLFTKDDIKVLSNRPYHEVHDHILSGIPKVKDAQAIELAIYSIFAESETPEDAIRTKIPDDCSYLFPKGFSLPDKASSRLRKIINSSTPMSSSSAMRKYISIARTILHFGCEIFDASLETIDNEKALIRPIKVSIGPFGVHIFLEENNKDMAKLSYQSIVAYSQIAFRLVLRCTQDNGIAYSINIVSENAKRIRRILDMYTKIFVPFITQREQIQSMGNDPLIQGLVDSIGEHPLALYTTPYVGHPTPPSFNYNPEWFEKEVIKMALFYLAFNSNRSYIVLYQDINSCFRWLEQDRPLLHVQPKENGHLYVLPTSITIQVCTTFGPIKSIQCKTRAPICDHVTKAVNEFGLGNPFGFTFYEFSGDGQRPLDFLIPLPIETPFYSELIVKRRFFLVTKQMLEDSMTIISVFRDVNDQIIFGNNNQITEDQLIELAVLFLYSNTNNPKSILQNLSEMTEDDYSNLFPDSVPIDDDLKSRFTNRIQTYPVLDASTACHKYISLAINTPNFGSEIVKCLYTNNTEKNKKSSKSVMVRMNSKSIQITDEKDGKIITDIQFYCLISHKYEVGYCIIKYQDYNGAYSDITLESEIYSSQIGSYIADILDLYRIISENNHDILIEIPNFSRNSPSYEASNLEFDNVSLSSVVDAVYQFSDITSIDVASFDDDFITRSTFSDTIRVADTFDISSFSNLSIKQDAYGSNENDTDLSWRANPDALVATRNSKFLDEVENEINIISSTIESSNGFEAIQKMEALNEQIMQHAALSPTPELSSIQSAISSIIELNQCSSINSPTIMQSSPLIVSQIKSIISTTEVAKQKTNEIIQSIKEDAKSLNLSKDQTKSPILTRCLIDISEIQENISDSLVKSFDKVSSIGFNPSSLVNSLKDTSLQVTQLASIIQRENGEEVFTRVIPQLKTCSKNLDDIQRVISLSRSNAIDLSSTIELHNKLQNLVLNAEKIVLSSKVINEDQSKRKFQLFLGDHRKVESVSTNLDDFVSMASSLSTVKDIKENESLSKYLDINLPRVQSCASSLKKQISALNQNPMNDTARTTALNSLYKTRDVITEFYNTLKPIGQKEKSVNKTLLQVASSLPMIDTAICTLSTINILPTSLQEISSDISKLVSRYEKEKKLYEKKIDKTKIQMIDQSIMKLNSINNTICGYSKELEFNPANGDAIMSSQSVLIELKESLPSMTENISTLHKVTQDQIYPLILEGIERKIHSTLTEEQSTEDLSKSIHVAHYQQVQIETGRLLNQMIQISQNISDISVRETLGVRISEIRSIYMNQISIRNLLHERPYNPEYLQRAKVEMENSKDCIDKIVTFTKESSEALYGTGIESYANMCQKVCGASIQSLNSAPLGKFHKPPEPNAVIILSKGLHSTYESVKSVISRSDTEQNSEFAKRLNSMCDKLEVSLICLDSQVKTPTIEFFSISDQLSKRLNKVKQALLSSAQENHQILQELDTSINSIALSMQDTPPNIDMARRCILDTIPHLMALKSCTLQLQIRDDFSHDNSIQTLMKSWIHRIEEIEFTINSKIGNDNFDIKDINNTKDLLVHSQAKITNIPNQIKPYLRENEIDLLSRAICDYRNSSSIAINCVRLLPTCQKLTIDTSAFKEISIGTSIQDFALSTGFQLSALSSIISQLEREPMIMKLENVFNILKEMYQLMSCVDPRTIMNHRDEKELLVSLDSIKKAMPYVLKNSLVLTGFINTEAFQNSAKILYENINRLYSMISKPHLTDANSSLFVQSINDVIPFISMNIVSFAQSNYIKQFPSVLTKLNTLNSLIEYSKNLNTMDLNQKQSILDQIYLVIPLIIHDVFEYNENQEFVDSLIITFSKVAPFTTLPRSSVIISSYVLMRNINIDSSSLENAFYSSLASFEPQASILPSQINPVLDIVSSINEKKSGLPNSLVYASQILTQLLKSKSMNSIAMSSRIIASCSKQTSDRIELNTSLFIKSCVKVANIVQSIRNVLDNVDEKLFSASSIKLSDESLFYYSQLSKSIRDSDFKLLIQCQNFSSSVLVYSSYQMINTYLFMFIKSISSIPSLAGVLSLLKEISDDFFSWHYESECDVMGLFFSIMDCLVDSVESLLHDESVQLNNNAESFVYQSLPLLSYKHRYLSYDMNNVSKLVRQYHLFLNDIYPSIFKGLINSQIRDIFSKNISSLDVLKPIVSSWSMSNVKFSLNQTRIMCESVFGKVYQCLCIIKSNTKISLSDILKIIHQSLTSLSFLKHNLSVNQNDKQFNIIFQSINSLTNTLNEGAHTLKPKTDLLIRILDDSIKSSQALCQIDFSVLHLSQNGNSPIMNIDMIKNKNSLASAKAATALLKGFQTTLDRIDPEESHYKSTMIRAQLAQNIQNLSSPLEKSPEIASIEVANVKSLIEIESNSLLQATTKPISVIKKSLPELIQSIPQSSISISMSSYNSVLSSIQSSIVVQKYQSLNNFIMIDFPDIIAMYEKKNDFSKPQIDNAFKSIQEKLSIYGNNEKLHEILARESPEELLLQNLLLSDSIARIPEIEIPSQIIQSFSSGILSSIIKQNIPKGNTYQFLNESDTLRIVSRGTSIMVLIESLMSLSSEIIRINPELFRFIKLNEGFESMISKIPINTIIEILKSISQELDLIYSIDTLTIFLQKLTNYECVYQIRVINGLIKIIISNGNGLLHRTDLDTTRESVMSAISVIFIDKVKEDSEILGICSLVSSDLMIKVENYLSESMGRVDSIQKLLLLKQSQVKNLNLMGYNRNQIDIPPQLESIHSASVIKQLGFLSNHNELIKEMAQYKQEDIDIQQQLIDRYISILACPDILLNDENVMNMMSSSISSITNLIVKKEQSIIKASTQPLKDIIPLNLTTISGSIQNLEICSSLAKRSHEVIHMMNSFEKAFPHINELIIEKTEQIEETQIEKARGLVIQASYLMRTNPESIQQFISALNEPDRYASYAVLNLEADSIRTNTDNHDITAVSNRSILFDKASLMQKEPNAIGKTKITDLAKASNLNSESKKSYVVSSLKTVLLLLRVQRIDVFPELIKSMKTETAAAIIKKVKISRLPALQKSIENQIRFVNSIEKIREELQSLSQSERYVQQLLLYELLSTVRSSKLLAPVIKEISFKGSSTIIVLRRKLLISLFEMQKKKYPKSFAQISKVKKPTQSQVIEQYQAEIEKNERYALSYQLHNAIYAITQAFPSIVSYSQDKSGTSALKAQFSPEELTSKHSLIRSIIALNSNINDTKLLLREMNQKEHLRLIYIIQTLASSIAPKKTVPTPSILEKPLNPERISLGIRGPDIIPPTAPEVFASLVQSTTSLVNSIQALSSVPINDCKPILIEESSKVVSILSRLNESRSATYLPEVQQLVEIAPQLIASMTRVLPSIEKDIRAQLIGDPTNIMSMIAEIQKNSIALNDPDSLKRYRGAITDMMISIKKVDAAINPSCQSLDPIDCAASLAKAIDSKDVLSMTNELIKFETSKVQASITGQGIKQIELLEPLVSQIVPFVKQIDSSPSAKINTKVMEKIRPSLVKIITKETTNPFTSLQAISKPAQIKQVIDQTQDRIEIASNSLLKSISIKDKSTASEALNDVIKRTAESQAAIIRSFTINTPTSIVPVVDFITNLGSSITSLGSILAATKSSSVTPSIIMKSQRSLSRIVNQIQDSTPLSPRKNSKSKPLSQFDEKKFAFVKSATNAFQSIIAAVSARASSKIPETFTAIFNEQLPLIEKTFSEIKTKGTSIINSSSDKASSNDLKKQLANLVSKFESFTKTIKNNDSTELINVAEELVQVSQVLVQTTCQISQLKSGAIESPDLENSEKIPPRLIIPSVPDDVTKIKAIDAQKQFKKCVSSYDRKQEEFVSLSLLSNTPNLKMVEMITDLHSLMKTVLVQVLRLSALAIDFEAQGKLASITTQLVTQFNSLLRLLRNRLLLNCQNWEPSVKSITQQISDNENQALRISEIIVKASTAAEEFKKVFGQKVDEAIIPLNSIQTRLFELQAQISKTTILNAKEWSQRIVDIGTKICDSLLKVFINAKDHPTEKISADPLISFALVCIPELEYTDTRTRDIISGKTNEIEPIVSDCMKRVVILEDKFNSLSISGGKEVSALKETISAICKAAKSIVESIEASMKQSSGKKPMVMENKDKMAPIKVSTDEELMKRLSMETNVIKARHLLERYEKKLKDLK